MTSAGGAAEPIAIVGVGAVFPGAGTAGRFWDNVRSGVDAIGEVPAHRWDPAVYYDPEAYERAPETDRFYCRRGGFVDELATFDPARFGMMPAAVDGMEPDQLLALRTAAEAIADAGGRDRLPAGERVGVVIGRGGYITPGVARLDGRVRTSYQLVGVLRDLLPGIGEDRLAAVRAAFCERLGPDRPDGSYGLVPSFAAARIADRFDLHGPAYTVDAACASSLVAVEHGVRALRSGQCDAVLAGAVHHAHHVTVWGVFSRLRALSRSERIRPFDRAADGTLLSEGTGVVVLKRLADARRDGDRVYAVVRGAGSSSDGRAGSLMSPAADGQVLAVERAWRDAGLDPRVPGALGLLEAHGTGTALGDEVELETLRRAFGGPGDGPPIGLGTVKSMIGHAMPASGIAGLIKVACALRDGVLPPTLHIEDPHEGLASTRMSPVHEAAEWEPPGDGPRRAGVNAFGFGGANAHLVLEEAPPEPAPAPALAPIPPPPDEEDAAEPVLRLAAGSVAELAGLLAAPDEDLLAMAAEQPPVLDGPCWDRAGRDGAGRDSTGRDGAGPGCRLAVVAPTPRRLELARAVVSRGTPWRGRSDVWFAPSPLLAGGGRLAFLFPGFEPVFEPRIDDIAGRFGLPLPDLTGRADLIGHAADVMAVGDLLAAALRGLGVEPDVAAGHSLGEWTAMNVMGLYPPDAVRSVMDAIDRGGLDVPDAVYAALACGVDRAAEAIADVEGVVVSHDNCPRQSVICGPPDAVGEILERLRAEGVLCQELPFRSGFHTPAAEVYRGTVDEAFTRLTVRPPRVPVWSATTLEPFPGDPAAVRELVLRHLLEPVRFGRLVERLYEAGVRAFVQVGPGSLAGFAADALGGREHLAIAVNVPRRGGLAQLRRVAAALWAEGYAPPEEPAPEADGGVRLDLGAPLVSLAGAALPPLPPLQPLVPAARAPEQPEPAEPAEPPKSAGLPGLPGLPGPVAAEFAALVREAETSARAVLRAFGGGITTSREFSLETMPYIADHCLVPQRPDWPDASDRFPVVPLTTLLEVMAEVAAEVLPGPAVIGFADVRALRWVVADPPTPATIRAAVEGPGRVRVTIEGHTEGTVLLGDRYPAAPEPDRTPLTGERPPEVTAERLYAERWMFHGPRYRGVAEISALAGDGLRGVLAAPPTPGALLDSVGQLCGHWNQIYGERDQTVIPVAIDRVTFHGPPPEPAERLDVTIRNRAVSSTTIRCDAEMRDAAGGVWGRVEGWTTRRFYTDEAVWRMRFAPELSGIGERRPGGSCVARRRWDGTSARDLLMRLYLRAEERAAYERLDVREQGPWLLGRIAAKDAVRHRHWDAGGGPLFPAELAVRDAGAGRVAVAGPYEAPLAMTITHGADQAAAAIVGTGPETADEGGAAHGTRA